MSPIEKYHRVITGIKNGYRDIFLIKKKTFYIGYTGIKNRYKGTFVIKNKTFYMILIII